MIPLLPWMTVSTLVAMRLKFSPKPSIPVRLVYVRELLPTRSIEL